jgi:uncharacterized protein YndB with AHSA1/START domain
MRTATPGTALLVAHRAGAAGIEIDASAADVFGAVTDVAGLPRWNAHIRRVLQAPTEPLAEGVEWVVLMRALGTTWPSRARVLRHDARSYRFEHLSRSDDGNPSWAEWRWQVTPVADGRSRLAVEWELNPRSFWRQALFARIRHTQLDDEVQASLAELARQLQAARRAPA